MRPKAVLLKSCLFLLCLCCDLLAADSDKVEETPRDTLPLPETRIIEKWRGTWDVKAMRHQPEPAQELTYAETFEWVLDGRYLRSETSR